MQKYRLATESKYNFYIRNQNIFSQGDMSSYFYIIINGEFEILRVGKNPSQTIDSLHKRNSNDSVIVTINSSLSDGKAGKIQ